MSNENNALIGKTVLITGGGGMIGSQICRQAAAMKPARIVCLGQNLPQWVVIMRSLWLGFL